MASSPDTSAQADWSTLPVDFARLVAQVRQLPEEHRREIEPTVERIVDFTRRRRKILELIQEALAQLRVDMKYLMFDLEATRRERDQFRQQLDGEA